MDLLSRGVRMKTSRKTLGTPCFIYKKSAGVQQPGQAGHTHLYIYNESQKNMCVCVCVCVCVCSGALSNEENRIIGTYVYYTVASVHTNPCAHHVIDVFLCLALI
jgi:hypothetical protein